MRAFAFALILPIAGCALPRSPGSGDISTLDLDFTAEAHDDGATTVVEIHVDSPVGDVRFTGGDRLTLTAGGSGRPLTVVEDGDGIHYEASFGDADGDFTIDLLRPHDRSITGLAFYMPPSFGLAAPDIDADGPIALTWNAGDGQRYTSTVAIQGDCIEPFARALSKDTGSYTVLPAEFSPRGAGGRCPLDVSLERASTTSVEVNEVLRIGSLYATTTQARRVRIAWGP